MRKRNADTDLQDLDHTPINKRIKVEEPEIVSIVEEKKPSYFLEPELVNGLILTDLKSKDWRVGKPIGKGSFGEIFLASDVIDTPVTAEDAKYVVKIEPHSNGPLFVEIHCLINVSKSNEENSESSGLPEFIASGSATINNNRYRFLILPRYKTDLHSIIKNSCVDQKSVLILADQILDIMQRFHDKGYAHSDIKAENLMIGNCKIDRIKSRKTTANNENGNRSRNQSTLKKRPNSSRRIVSSDEESSAYETPSEVDDNEEQEFDGSEYSAQEDDDEEEDDEEINDENFINDDDDDDDDDEEDEDENNDDDESVSSASVYATPMNRTLQTGKKLIGQVDFAGSNPVRSCRMTNGCKNTSVYQDMLSSHYLRPHRRINYKEAPSDEENGDNSSGLDDEVRNLFNHTAGKKNRSRNKHSYEVDRNFYVHPSSLNRINVRRRLFEKNGKRKNEKDKGGSNHDSGHDEDEDIESVIEDRIFLIDFGLASKFIASTDEHRPFVMDQRRAHDGTLEFTSRDAHMGAHFRRSDLECLGYNLLYWCQGSLPWKNPRTMSQPEQVHRMKELFMDNIKESMKHFYSKSAPKFIIEYLEYVGQLPYNERPDYNRCKQIFRRAFTALGYRLDEMVLDIEEMKRRLTKRNEEIENNNLDSKNAKSMLKLGIMIPFKENSFNSPNRISPKNLRSTAEKIPKKQRKKFCWTEVLSSDPDQIARERADREFERDQADGVPDETKFMNRKYTGKPTYAILEFERRIRMREEGKPIEPLNDENAIKGYTKAMMDVLRKKKYEIVDHSDLVMNGKKIGYSKKVFDQSDYQGSNEYSVSSKAKKLSESSRQSDAFDSQQSDIIIVQKRRKSGLRSTIRQTNRAISYHHNLMKKKIRRAPDGNSHFVVSEESMSVGSLQSEDCSRSSSEKSSTTGCTSTFTGSRSNCDSNDNMMDDTLCQDSNMSILESMSDEDEFSPIKTRTARNALICKRTTEETKPCRIKRSRKQPTPKRNRSKTTQKTYTRA